jgi:hypothetical protein
MGVRDKYWRRWTGLRYLIGTFWAIHVVLFRELICCAPFKRGLCGDDRKDIEKVTKITS